jgi:hypothetical protein
VTPEKQLEFLQSILDYKSQSQPALLTAPAQPDLQSINDTPGTSNADNCTTASARPSVKLSNKKKAASASYEYRQRRAAYEDKRHQPSRLAKEATAASKSLVVESESSSGTEDE